MSSLVLIDDHQVFREALRAYLANESDLHVVGDAGSVSEGLKRVDEHQPDVVVLDLSMPDVDGFAAAQVLRNRQPAPRVLVLSMHTDDGNIARAIAAGATGYVSKEQPASALVSAIRSVARGTQVLPPTISRFALDDRLATLRGAAPPSTATAAPTAVPDGPAGPDRPDRIGAHPPASPLSPLTAREKEVFALLIGGASNAAIACELRISIKTVETHRARLLKKLEAHSMADLVRFAARHGLLRQ